jgi:hypothetical protein
LASTQGAVRRPSIFPTLLYPHLKTLALYATSTRLRLLVTLDIGIRASTPHTEPQATVMEAFLFIEVITDSINTTCATLWLRIAGSHQLAEDAVTRVNASDLCAV